MTNLEEIEKEIYTHRFMDNLETLLKAGILIWTLEEWKDPIETEFELHPDARRFLDEWGTIDQLMKWIKEQVETPLKIVTG